METYFAAPERAEPDVLRHQVHVAATHPVVSGLLTAASGLLAVLNEQRQVLAVNEALLDWLGLPDAASVLGLRPGETIGCPHPADMPGGCGTTPYCATCGLAIAIVATRATGQPEERRCVITTTRGDQPVDVCFRVRASVAALDEQQLIFLFVQDMTASQRWAEIERTFFHDVSNLLTGLVGRSQLLVEATDDTWREDANELCALALRLAGEVSAQKALAREEPGTVQLSLQELTADAVLREVERQVGGHPAARGKSLVFAATDDTRTFRSDLRFIARVLSNMAINGLEATEAGGEVRVAAERSSEAIAFTVWNRAAIPEPLALRIFQRHFSTKPGAGRGLGTFSMRLFGERFLGGKVDFTTSPDAGTTFRLRLPLEGRDTPRGSSSPITHL